MEFGPVKTQTTSTGQERVFKQLEEILSLMQSMADQCGRIAENHISEYYYIKVRQYLDAIERGEEVDASMLTVDIFKCTNENNQNPK